MTTASSSPFDHLVAVDELHAAVRKWTEHIPQNLPYVDLMFAFGFATLGDRPRAESLVEAARKVMVVPIPDPMPYWGDEKKPRPFVVATASNFLFKAFKYRVDQALAKKPHAGPLPDDLHGELSELRLASETSRLHPAKLAHYVVSRMREQCSIVEPYEHPSSYSLWSKPGDALHDEVALWGTIREASELAARVMKLLDEGTAGHDARVSRLLALEAALPVAPRVGEAFSVELIQRIPTALSDAPSDENRIPPRTQTRVLHHGLLIAGHYGRTDLVHQLLVAFADLVHNSPADERFRLANEVAWPGFRVLKKLGMRDEIDRFLAMLQSEVLENATLDELRARYSSKLDAWSSVLQTLLSLAGGWLSVGLPERAKPILNEVRSELLRSSLPRFDAKDYTPLARAYVTALSEGPGDAALARITELFRLMDPKKITNTWTTAQYYSRFHLNLVEDAVFAVCRMDFAAPHVVSV